MANILKRAVGKATTAGTQILTVPAGSTVTIIGIRASNIGSNPRKFHAKIANTFVSGKDLPLPSTSAIDLLVGSKLVAQAGDQIQVYADANNEVDVFVSYLEQTA